MLNLMFYFKRILVYMVSYRTTPIYIFIKINHHISSLFEIIANYGIKFIKNK